MIFWILFLVVALPIVWLSLKGIVVVATEGNKPPLPITRGVAYGEGGFTLYFDGEMTTESGSLGGCSYGVSLIEDDDEKQDNGSCFFERDDCGMIVEVAEDEMCVASSIRSGASCTGDLGIIDNPVSGWPWDVGEADFSLSEADFFSEEDFGRTVWKRPVPDGLFFILLFVAGAVGIYIAGLWLDFF